MNISHQEKLQLALANARQALGKSASTGRPALSNLNKLRGIDAVEDTRSGDLITRTGVKTRPVFDMVADNILGKSEPWKSSIDLGEGSSSLAQIAAERIGGMRDKQITEEIQVDDLSDDLGVLKDGRPIWAEVLDSQRGYSTNSTDFGMKDLSFKPKWPPVQFLSEHNTWKSWHVVEENSRASNACEKVISKPGTSMNPLLILGESGCGKSTTGRAILQLLRPTGGRVVFDDEPIHEFWKKKGQKWVWDHRLLDLRRRMQMIFQDPYSSLNSRMTVEDIVSEPIRFHRSTENSNETSKVIKDLITFVGMPVSSLKKYPHEFSGGQRQRISIARALASRPEILICDEPTSALDVSVQANILNLLKDLQEELSLTMLFISHDLPVIRQMCDRVAVMQNGKICEIAETDKLFDYPEHEYSKHLLGLMPRMDLFRL